MANSVKDEVSGSETVPVRGRGRTTTAALLVCLATLLAVPASGQTLTAEPLAERGPQPRAASDCDLASPDRTARSWLFGLDLGVGSGGSVLFRIDPETAEICRIGATGLENVYDIAFLPDGRLFGIRSRPPDSDLVEINPRTGEASIVGSGIGFDGVNGLVAASIDALWGSTPDEELLWIDAATGVGTKIGEFGSSIESYGDLAFGPDGRLYLAACAGLFGCTPTLAEVDTATGEATLKPLPLGFSGVFGLAFEPKIRLAPNDLGPPDDMDRAVEPPRLLGVAYGDRYQQPHLIEIDTELGAATSIAPLDTFDGMGGLAANVRLPPVWGPLVVTDENSLTPPPALNCRNQPNSWTFCQHETGFHQQGDVDDTFAWDMNLRFPAGVVNADDGEPVFPVAPGRVVQKIGSVAHGGSLGLVHVEHGSNCDDDPDGCWWSGYLHMDPVTVQLGANVGYNDHLGFVGGAGVGDGNEHLHFAVYEGENEQFKEESVDIVFEQFAVPPETVGGGTVSVTSDFIARQELHVGPNFRVAGSVRVHLRAGERVLLRNGFRARRGSEVVIETATAPLVPGPFAALEGTWGGIVSQYVPPVGPYPMEIRFDAAAPYFGIVGRVSYPTLPCDGVMLGLGAQDTEYAAQERLEPGACFDRGIVRLTHDPANRTLSWRWYHEDGVFGADATLTPR